MKAIQKVMFKTQHEGENVKLIIPLEVVLDLDKSPTLEFAETIEVSNFLSFAFGVGADRSDQMCGP